MSAVNTPMSEANMTGETTLTPAKQSCENEDSNGSKRGRKAKYATDEERKEARRIRQRNYYNRIKNEKRELLNLQALRRYYIKKIRNNESPEKNEILTAKLSAIEARIHTPHDLARGLEVHRREYSSRPRTSARSAA